MGFNIRNNYGTSIISDSIVVQANGANRQWYVFSVASGYQLNRVLGIQAGLNYNKSSVGYTLYNSAEVCTFCPVTKVAFAGAHSINLSLLPELRLILQRKPLVSLSLVGGIRADFNVRRRESDVAFNGGKKHQGIAASINQLDEAIKPLYFNSVIGAKVVYSKFVLLAVLDRNISASITNPISVYGSTYDINTATNTFTLQLAYKLVDFQK